jgi:hypothetical protein
MCSVAMPSRRTRIGLVLALVAIATVVVIAVATGSKDRRPGVEVGFNNNAVGQGVAEPRDAARLIAGTGAEIDRVQIDWHSLEPVPGVYRWERYDAIYEADLDAGLRPLFIFAYAPEWAHGDICPLLNRDCHAPPAPEFVDDAARTAAKIARRYPRAAGIEIWNEPNLPYFWHPAADPAAYADLLAAAHDAIKQVDPGMPVLGGSTSDSQIDRPGQIEAPEFVRAILAAGAGRKMNALSVHAYPDPADVSGRSAVMDLESVRDVLGKRRLPIWITETGISTSGPGAVSPEAQALALVNLDDELAKAPGVDAILVHTLVRPHADPSSPEGGFGIVDQDLVPTQAYCDLAEAWGGEPGEPC